MNDKEQIIKRNKDISDAILVSQMQDTEGFAIVKEYLNGLSKKIRFQDIMGIRDEKVLYTQQGVSMAIDDIIQFFEDKKRMAMLKMVDPDTGEEEILNNK